MSITSRPRSWTLRVTESQRSFAATKATSATPTPDWSNPTAKWTFHSITPKGNWQRFTHGLGVGDINGDGRLDMIFKDGWFEQPVSLGADPTLEISQGQLRSGRRADVFLRCERRRARGLHTALAAHGYGLAWHEQLAEKDADGSPKWRSHVFMHKEAQENRYGVHVPDCTRSSCSTWMAMG
jgi:hypothetical protein